MCALSASLLWQNFCSTNLNVKMGQYCKIYVTNPAMQMMMTFVAGLIQYRTLLVSLTLLMFFIMHYI